jgi:hypothetical protein
MNEAEFSLTAHYISMFFKRRFDDNTTLSAGINKWRIKLEHFPLFFG